MRVRYPGHMKGFHVIGRRGVALTPGENDVDDAMGRALLAQDIVMAMPVDVPAEPGDDQNEHGRDEGDD